MPGSRRLVGQSPFGDSPCLVRRDCPARDCPDKRQCPGSPCKWKTSLTLDGTVPEALPPCDPDHVLAAAEGAPVEPAIEGRDLEAGSFQQRLPFVGRQPGERHP